MTKSLVNENISKYYQIDCLLENIKKLHEIRIIGG